MSAEIRVYEENNLRVLVKRSGRKIDYLSMPINIAKPITKLSTPLHLDVSMGNKCNGGCPYCYADAKKNGIFYENTTEKIIKLCDVLGDKKPLQFAIGGECEPTQHPDFIDFLKTSSDLGVIPNYTTNAMSFTTTILDTTIKYCGSVGVSTHKHLSKLWQKNLPILLEAGINTRLHVIIGEENSADYFADLYRKYYDKVDCITILIMRNTGRGTTTDCLEQEFLKTIDFLRINEFSKIAITELSQPLLNKYTDETEFLGLSKFTIGTYGGYVILDDTFLIIRESSFEPNKIKNNLTIKEK